MISWANYHSHTNYCDGAEAPEEYAKEAVRLGLPAYGYSSHAPVPFSSDWNIPDDKLKNYLSEISEIKEKYKTWLQVYLALEIDFIPGIAGRSRYLMKDTSLDYFIGSVHFLEKFPNGEYWNIDTSYELFESGLKEIFDNNFHKAALRFWETTRQMITEDSPDIIGHLDKIKMFNSKNRYFNENERWYKDQVELTFDTIKDKDCIVEINTRGFYRYGQPDLYPAEWIIRKIAEKDIPVIISSDAHKPEEILKGFPYAASILKKSGIKKLAAFYNDKWNEYPFSDKGIHFR